MKRTIPIFATIALFIGSIITSCDQTTTIGNSIISDQIDVVVDSTFTLTGHSVPNKAVISRTLGQLVGSIDAKGFGHLSSDVVTQFMPSAQLDTAGVKATDIDSLMLVMNVNRGEYIGDSIAPLGLTIYPLVKQLPSPIYSNFDPQGYYDPNTVLGSTIYSTSQIGLPDSVKRESYTSIRVKLPLQLAQKIYNEYRTNPETFSSPERFAQFFPGIYISNSFGSGRVTRISTSMMQMYYHRHFYDEEKQRDSTQYKIGNYFAVTPEIVTNNCIDLAISPAIQQEIQNGQTIIMAPTGLDAEIKLPVPEIIAAYHSAQSDLSVLNALTIRIPANEIPNNYGITVPQYLLMVQTDSKDNFFLKNLLPDNKTSFYAEYSPTEQCYYFTGLRDYIIAMIEKGSDLTEADYTFTLTPVSAVFESSGSNSYYYGNTSTTLSTMTPYVATPVMARLHLDKAKIMLTYSTQTITF